MKQDFTIINGGYYCTAHEAKNCVLCFDQDNVSVVERISREILTNPKLDYENIYSAGLMKFLDSLEESQ